MDRFLKSEASGKLVDSENPFTIDRGRSREKLLQSIPPSNIDSVFRLLQAAAWELGIPPEKAICVRHVTKSSDGPLTLSLLGVPPKRALAQTLEELREPFGSKKGYSTLAKAVFRSTAAGLEPQLAWSGGSLIGGTLKYFSLKKDKLEIPDDLDLKNPSTLTLRYSPFGEQYQWYRSFQTTLPHDVHSLLKQPERVLPLESRIHKVDGFFQYRTAPFTGIRSYVRAEDSEPGMQTDLWEGPYDAIDAQTILLSRREPGKFLFLRWRPDYGKPTFLHHTTNAELSYGVERYRASFLVETLERSAQVQFYSDGMVSDPVPIEGPVGMSGLVVWPGLSFDLWGSRLVEDENYHSAMDFARKHALLTAKCLKENIDRVLERVSESNLVGKSYIDETVDRLRRYWG